MKQSTRRNFIAQSALAGIGTLIALPSQSAIAATKNTLHTLIPLPWIFILISMPQLTVKM